MLLHDTEMYLELICTTNIHVKPGRSVAVLPDGCHLNLLNRVMKNC